MQGAITVRDLGKVFRVNGGNQPTTLKGYLAAGRKRAAAQTFWGLRHISFSVPKGRAVGVVGLNGAGKSTLLRLIGGVGKVDEGSIAIKGRIGALLDIGAGLTEDLTGKENIYLLGVIAGMLRNEITARFDEIVTFAELDEFIDAPVRTYSSGMRMRLAFSVAVHTQPEILLIDEVLAVGDKAFQQKCFNRVADIRATGCTIFLVSHDISQIEALCDDVLFLEKGRMVAYGPLHETLALYSSSVDTKVSSTKRVPHPASEHDESQVQQESEHYGSGEVRIRDVAIRDGHGNIVPSISCGQAASISFAYETFAEVRNPIALVGIYDESGFCCFESNTEIAGLDIDTPNGLIDLGIQRLDLAPGRYLITVGVFSTDWQRVYDYHDGEYPIMVTGRKVSKGLLAPPVHWKTVG